MIYKVAPKHGRKNPLIYLSICSTTGSVSIMAIKAFGLALKMTFAGNNQFTHPSTYVFVVMIVGCILTQMNYFNKALSQFSTNMYMPIQQIGLAKSTANFPTVSILSTTLHSPPAPWLRLSSSSAASTQHPPSIPSLFFAASLSSSPVSTSSTSLVKIRTERTRLETTSRTLLRPMAYPASPHVGVCNHAEAPTDLGAHS